MNLFAYGLNNSPNVVDHFGAIPISEQLWLNPNFVQTAMTAAKQAHDHSETTGLESGTVMFQGSKGWAYDPIVDGRLPTADELKVNPNIRGVTEYEKCPHLRNAEVTVHSHNTANTKGVVDTGDPSSGDKIWAVRSHIDSVVVGRNGDVKMFSHFDNQVHDLGNIFHK